MSSSNCGKPWQILLPYLLLIIDIVASCWYCVLILSVLVDQANRDYGPPPPIPPPPALDAYSSYRGLAFADTVYAAYCMWQLFVWVYVFAFLDWLFVHLPDLHCVRIILFVAYVLSVSSIRCTSCSSVCDRSLFWLFVVFLSVPFRACLPFSLVWFVEFEWFPFKPSMLCHCLVWIFTSYYGVYSSVRPCYSLHLSSVCLSSIHLPVHRKLSLVSSFSMTIAILRSVG